MTIFWSVFRVVYWLIHGMCLWEARDRINKIKWVDFTKNVPKNKPLFFRLQPPLIALAFLLGPVGLMVYFIGTSLLPKKQRVWYH